MVINLKLIPTSNRYFHNKLHNTETVFFFQKDKNEEKEENWKSKYIDALPKKSSEQASESITSMVSNILIPNVMLCKNKGAH